MYVYMHACVDRHERVCTWMYEIMHTGDKVSDRIYMHYIHVNIQATESVTIHTHAYA
jgi:hypothetical protein